MSDYLLVGKIINTFGIKGELKITSDFEYQDRVYRNNTKIYIGDDKKEEIINTSKIHKGYLIVALNNLNNINDVLKYKNLYVYIKREELNLNNDEYLTSDLINYEVYDEDKLIGKVIDFEYSKLYTLLKVRGEKDFYIPKIDKFIKKIDFQAKIIYTNGGSGLIL